MTRVAQEYIDPARLLTVVVGDRAKIAPALAALDLGETADVAVA